MINYLCLISIFIAYLAYTFFIYNKSNALNYFIYSIADYSIMMINLDDIYEKFEENLAYIQNKEDEFSNSYQKLDFKLYEEKLGFEPDKNMSKLNLFKKFLEKKLFKNYNIKRIDLCYNLNEIISLQKSLEELDEKIERIEFDQSMIEKNNKKGIKGDKRIYYSYLCCEESLESIKKEKKDKEKTLNELIESSKENNNFCGVAFATFNTIKEQEDYLHKKKYSCCSSDKNKDTLESYKRKIIFERAPEPEDIIFENFNTGLKNRFLSIMCNCENYILIIFLYIIIGINIYLYYYQSKIDKSSNKTIILNVFSYSLTIASAINDFILEIFSEKFAKIFKYITFTHFYSNYSLFLSSFWFFNSCLIPALFEIFYQKEEHEILTDNLITKFLFNAFVTPIMWTINFKFLKKKFKQCIIEHKDKINLNQKELNELYELQSMNVAMKYCYLQKTSFMSFFFAPVFPLGFCISLLGFIFGYWLEKYNLSKMYKKPEKLDKQIAELYVNGFSSIFVSFLIGNIIFLYSGLVKSSVVYIYYYNVFGIFLSIILFLLVKCVRRDYFGFKESEIHKKTYDEMYLNFSTDYERANPMTRFEGEMRYLDKLAEKNKINKIAIDKRKKKIKGENQIKFYLQKQRLSRIINIKELNKLINLDDDNDQEKDKDIICNIIPTIDNYKKEKKSKTGRSGKITFNNE